MNFSSTICYSEKPFWFQRIISAGIEDCIFPFPFMKYLIRLLLLVTDRADGGQEVLHEMTDYQSNAHAEVHVEDVT